jgi:nicotinate-nucleotide adenylyltransferase
MLTQPIGIFGGTFDPIHCGHLAVADYLTAHLPLAQIQFIPCLMPPHREPPQATPAQRLAMIRLAIQGHPQWVANDIDFQRSPPSYMVDTLTLLRRQQPQTPFCLILGMDAFLHFNQWRRWEDILTLSHLVIVNRPDFVLPAKHWSADLFARAQIQSAAELAHAIAGKILLQSIPPSPLSSTAIRSQPNLFSPDTLPPTVAHYIQQHHLYEKSH